jgi:hypothetical protein
VEEVCARDVRGAAGGSGEKMEQFDDMTLVVMGVS